MTDPPADAARSAAAILAPDLGPNLPAQVEAALLARDAGEQGPGQYDPLAIAGLGIGAASLVVSIAQLAWSILSEERKRSARPSRRSLERRIRISVRERDMPVPPGTDRIIDVVITEVVRLERPPRSQARQP